MKNKLVLALLISITIGACKKNKVTAIDNTISTGAQVKFGYLVARTINPPVQIKVDGERVSYNLTYSVSYPGGGANIGGSNTNDYLDIPAGAKNIVVSFVKIGTNVDSLVLYSGTINLAAAQRYSIMFTDSSSIKVATLSDAFDASIPPNNTTAVCRFYNGLIGVPAVDVYFGAATTPVFTNVAYNTATTMYAPITIGSTTIALRPAGALPTSTAIISYAAAITGGRVFTAIGRGIIGIAGASDIRRPLVSLITNR